MSVLKCVGVRKNLVSSLAFVRALAIFRWKWFSGEEKKELLVVIPQSQPRMSHRYECSILNFLIAVAYFTRWLKDSLFGIWAGLNEFTFVACVQGFRLEISRNAWFNLSLVPSVSLNSLLSWRFSSFELFIALNYLPPQYFLLSVLSNKIFFRIFTAIFGGISRFLAFSTRFRSNVHAWTSKLLKILHVPLKSSKNW